MFDDESRYRDLETYLVPDARGHVVRVVAGYVGADAALLGVHRRSQGQRLDHIAYRYLGNASAFWRIADANDAMLPEQLADELELDIPVGGR